MQPYAHNFNAAKMKKDGYSWLGGSANRCILFRNRCFTLAFSALLMQRVSQSTRIISSGSFTECIASSMNCIRGSLRRTSQPCSHSKLRSRPLFYLTKGLKATVSKELPSNSCLKKTRGSSGQREVAAQPAKLSGLPVLVF
eukprot:1157480-Pelagomonas_calceolata.AAC.12